MNTALLIVGELLLLTILYLQYKQHKTMSQLSDEIQALQADVAAEKTVVDSAVALINGFAAKLQAAIDAATAAGATAEQLQNLTDLHTSVTAQTTDLATAVANNP